MKAPRDVWTMEVPEEERDDMTEQRIWARYRHCLAAFSRYIWCGWVKKQTECMEMWWEYETVG